MRWWQWVTVVSFLAFGVSVTACGDDAGDNGTGGKSSGGSATAGASSGGSGGTQAAGSANGGTNISGGANGGTGLTGSGVGTTGDPCTQNSDCSSASDEPAECITTWAGGYCSAPCGLYLDCSGDTDDAACETVQGKKRCLEACAADNACRTGYRCDLDIFACVPR